MTILLYRTRTTLEIKTLYEKMKLIILSHFFV